MGLNTIIKIFFCLFVLTGVASNNELRVYNSCWHPSLNLNNYNGFFFLDEDEVCEVIPTPFSEGFNTDSTTLDCWTILDVNGDGYVDWGSELGSWFKETSTWNSFEGDGYARFDGGIWDVNSNDDWLISPSFELNGVYRLKYRYKIGYDGGEYGVYLSSSGINPESFTTVLLPTHELSSTDDQYKEKVIILNNIEGTINIGWHISSNIIAGTNMQIDLVTLEEVENCIEPFDLAFEELGQNEVTIKWENEYGANGWEYYVNILDGGVPEENGIVTGSNEGVLVTSLNNGDILEPNTEYEFYVRTVCEDTSFSVWSGPKKFRTLCEVIPIPFVEGFNENSETIDCWTIKNINEDGNLFELYFWSFYEGDQSIRYSNYDVNNHDDWLITPSFEGSGDYRVRFYYYSMYEDNAFSVNLSTSGVDIASFTEILPASTIAKTPTGWVEKVFYVTGITSTFNIGFYAGPNQSTGSKTFYLDYFRVEEIPDCPEPYEVVIENPTETSIEVNWLQYGDVENWEVVILPFGSEFLEENLEILTVEGNPTLTIENLDPGTLYTVYVRAICDENSGWSIPVSGGTKDTNDDCIDAINVPVNTGNDCIEFVNGTTLQATLSSDFDDPECLWDSPVNDVWFEFTTTTNYVGITISDVSSPFEQNPSFGIQVYQGIDCGDLEEIYCGENGWGGETYITLNVEPDTKYYIRILETYDADVFFNLCLTNPLPPIRTSESGEDYTVEELIKNVLVKSSCDLVSNVTYKTGLDFTGWDGAEANGIGYFNKNGSDFAFEDGVILATNGVVYGVGPAGSFEGNDSNNWLGDSDLQQLLIENGQTFSNHNASVIEFDFIPVTDTISFDFIFASNEYGPSYQCDYSDVFAFFLTDLSTGDVVNLAVIPDTNIPVSVTTIHSAAYQGFQTCGDANAEYFDVYYGDEGLPQKYSPINYGGMTIPMSAVSAVVPGQQYHIKLAIADYRDSGVNSAVFLRGGSFDLGTVDFGNDLLADSNNALCEGAEVTLETGFNTEWVNVKWFKDGVEIVGETESNLIVTEPGVYTVEGSYSAVPDCVVSDTIIIEFYVPIEESLKQPKNIEYCRNSLEEFIDLSYVEEGMLTEAHAKEDYEFLYYLLIEDRVNGENVIENATQFPMPEGEAVSIFIKVQNILTGCYGEFQFILKPITAQVPKNPGDQQICSSFEFPELPENQYYFSESDGKGIEYKAGDIIDIAGSYIIYIYSITGLCYEEVSFNVKITPIVKPFELEDVSMMCENFVLPNLPEGSKYYTGAGETGDILLPGEKMLLSQTIYIFTKSEEGPNHCTAESSFKVIYKDCPIPKGISPNGDGNNDRFDLSVHGVTSIRVYNRYGTEVFSYGKGYTDEWMGQDKNGNLLPDGTYYYVVISHGKVKTGWVQINK